MVIFPPAAATLEKTGMYAVINCNIPSSEDFITSKQEYMVSYITVTEQSTPMVLKDFVNPEPPIDILCASIQSAATAIIFPSIRIGSVRDSTNVEKTVFST